MHANGDAAALAYPGHHEIGVRRPGQSVPGALTPPMPLHEAAPCRSLGSFGVGVPPAHEAYRSSSPCGQTAYNGAVMPPARSSSAPRVLPAAAVGPQVWQWPGTPSSPCPGGGGGGGSYCASPSVPNSLPVNSPLPLGQPRAPSLARVRPASGASPGPPGPGPYAQASQGHSIPCLSPQPPPKHSARAHSADAKVDAGAVAGASLAQASAALEGAEETRTLRQSRLATQMKGQLRIRRGPGAASALFGPPLPGTLAPNQLQAQRDAHGGEQGGLRIDPHHWWQEEASQPGPVTQEVMMSVVRSLAADPATPLPPSFVGRVLSEAEEVLERSRHEPVARLELPRGRGGGPMGEPSPARLVVVGDTHGQLQDVLWIFFKHGLPSSSVGYLFNGDIADRGARALEIFTLVLGFMVACPGSMHVNRGNHEDEMLNHGPVGGFYDECLAKHGRGAGGRIFEQMRRIYALLPLAAVIGQSVFVVHGGLSRIPNFLGVLESVHRRRPTIPTDSHDARDVAMSDALWSDPCDTPGLSPSGRGGNTIKFGPDVTQNFLRESGLSLVVRSHEVPQSLDGVASTHGNRLLTVFSASNYCGSTGNQGAVLVFYEGAAGRLSFDVSRHFAPDLESGTFASLGPDAWQPGGSRPLRDAEHERAARRIEVAAVQRAMQRDPTNLRLHRDVLGQVARLVVEHKAALWTFFFRMDTEKNGFIDSRAWLAGCNAVLGGDLPWALLQRTLVPEETASSQVDYFAFLQRFRIGLIGDEVSDRWAEALLSRVYSRMLFHDMPLQQLLRHFDRDGDGTVTVAELRHAFAALDVGVTEHQAGALMRTISAHASRGSRDPGGGVDVTSFLSRFEMVYRPMSDRQDVPAWVEGALRRLGRHIWAGTGAGSEGGAPEERARAFFEASDTDGSGFLSYQEFAVAVGGLISQCSTAGLPFELSSPQLAELARWVDLSGEGRISYLEFLASFVPSDLVAGGTFSVDIMEHICTAVWANKPALTSACLLIDSQHTGEVTRQQLTEALRAMNLALDQDSPPITDEQIQVLMDHTRFDAGTGHIRYRHFLDSFQVFDTANQQ